MGLVATLLKWYTPVEELNIYVGSSRWVVDDDESKTKDPIDQAINEHGQVIGLWSNHQDDYNCDHGLSLHAWGLFEV